MSTALSLILLICLLCSGMKGFSQTEPLQVTYDEGLLKQLLEELHVREQEEEIAEQYQGFYDPLIAKQIRMQAYQYGKAQDLDAPVYESQRGGVGQESEEAFFRQMESWTQNLEDELGELGVDAGISLLYAQIEPLLDKLKETHRQLLTHLLPSMGGVPANDPLLKNRIDQEKEERNFKIWVRTVAEAIFHELFQKDALGKYQLQRANLRQLHEVGLFRYLKIRLIAWEQARVLELPLAEELLDLDVNLKTLYQQFKDHSASSAGLFQALRPIALDGPPPADWRQYQSRLLAGQQNSLLLNEMVQQRAKQLALTYRGLSERYLLQAREINEKLLVPYEMKLNDAQRLKAHQMAFELTLRASTLSSKAAHLLTESYQPSSKEKITQWHSLYVKTKTMYEAE